MAFLLVALQEKLSLQQAHPTQVHGCRVGQVAKVCRLQRHLPQMDATNVSTSMLAAAWQASGSRPTGPLANGAHGTGPASLKAVSNCKAADKAACLHTILVFAVTCRMRALSPSVISCHLCDMGSSRSVGCGRKPSPDFRDVLTKR